MSSQLNPTSVFKSASGLNLPVIGLGTWQSKDAEVEAAVDAALTAGYRLIDTAARYENEKVIGRVLQKWFKSGKLTREDIFITTKLPMQCNRPSLIRPCIEKQLKDLQLDHVDLYLVHHPVGQLPEGEATPGQGVQTDPTTDHVAIWKEMEKLVDASLTKSIGLSNFNVSQIQRVLAASRIPPANLQIELYLYQQAMAEQKFCQEHGITLTSYGSLGSRAAPAIVENMIACSFNPLEDPTVVKMALAHDKIPGQILLGHLIQSGVAVIPKSVNPDRINQNIQIFDFHLSDQEMAELNALDKGEEGRRFNVTFFRDHPEYPYPPPRKEK